MMEGSPIGFPMETETPRSTWAATEVSSENAGHLSDSTMLAFRCLGPMFFSLGGTRLGPRKSSNKYIRRHNFIYTGYIMTPVITARGPTL